ncbi:MAG: GTP cyclohydrolase I FolE [Alphaproteobacteria bacterium]
MTNPIPTRPSKEQAMEAVRTLIGYAGDDPSREGVIDTPKRVIKAFDELFSGYRADPEAELQRTFEEVEGYEDIVLLRDIAFESHCEHHMMPFIGRAHVAYLPEKRVVGISKLARAVEIYARRLQSQETMTLQIANIIDQVLKPRGVAVIVSAEHLCMTMRGVRKAGVQTVTSHYLGAFKDQSHHRLNLQALLGQ